MFPRMVTTIKVYPINFMRNMHLVKKTIIQDKLFLSRQIYQKIKVKGPISIADFMRDVLTNPSAGYYMHRDVFGESGDFVTSPEVSQMFGEMLAVWLINEWQKMGSPKPLQIVELGPGRGTLASDILKVFNHFKVLQQTTLQLVEVSPHLSELQSKKLCSQSSLTGEQQSSYRHGISTHGIPVHWYKQLKEVPQGFSIFIAHEFFDALPIHKFHLTYMGYKEVLIDIDPGKDSTDNDCPKFRYILARNPTPIQGVFMNPNEKRNHVEVSPESVLIYTEICERVKTAGGLALICDYGHDGTGTDTFRAFKDHKQVDPLESPGSADLTADVDFSVIRENHYVQKYNWFGFLRRVQPSLNDRFILMKSSAGLAVTTSFSKNPLNDVEIIHDINRRKVANQVKEVLCFGPVPQRKFLIKAGLDFRVDSLKQNITDKRQLENIENCYKMLTDEDKMGERFKFMVLIPETMKRILNLHPLVGFSEK